MSFIFTGAAHSVCAELSFTLENCTRFILCSLLSDFIVQRRIEFPGRWIAIEISHPDDKWPSFPRTSSGFKINVFSLRALLRVLLEISLTTEVKQTSQPPSYVLFDISGNWYMRGSIEQLCMGPCQSRGAPVQLELQEPGFLGSGTAKWCSCWGNDPPLKGLSLGILGYSVRKFHGCFWQRVSGASPASPVCQVDRRHKDHQNVDSPLL